MADHLRSAVTWTTRLLRLRLGLTLLVLAVANTLDGFITVYWLTAHPDVPEGNPFMAWAYAMDPWIFGSAKFALVTLGCSLLWRVRDDSRLTSWAATGLLLFYLYVLHMHVKNLLIVYYAPAGF